MTRCGNASHARLRHVDRELGVGRSGQFIQRTCPTQRQIVNGNIDVCVGLIHRPAGGQLPMAPENVECRGVKTRILPVDLADQGDGRVADELMIDRNVLAVKISLGIQSKRLHGALNVERRIKHPGQEWLRGRRDGGGNLKYRGAGNERLGPLKDIVAAQIDDAEFIAEIKVGHVDAIASAPGIEIEIDRLAAGGRGEDLPPVGDEPGEAGVHVHAAPPGQSVAGALDGDGLSSPRCHA